MLTHTPWNAVPGLRHGFLDAADSAGGDDWPAALARLGVDGTLVTPRQVHGIRVVEARPGERPDADALVTWRGGVLVGVVTADCVPVLLVDRARRTSGAVHAGWRGMAAGVLEATVAAIGGGAIEAAIGPAIGGCCYEVGPEVRAAFVARTGDTALLAWRPGPRREHVDLRTAARLLLAAAGVGAIDVLGPCTACDHAHHSFRRDGPRAGRQLSFVGWA
jgi:YfiH family protein